MGLSLKAVSAEADKTNQAAEKADPTEPLSQDEDFWFSLLDREEREKIPENA